MSHAHALQIHGGLRFQLPIDDVSVMAIGIDLKNSLCLAEGGDAHLSTIHGDINDPAIYQQVNDVLRQVSDIDVVACDLHPDLQSTRLAGQLADRLNIPLIRVQHHHAHIAAVLAEHGVEEAAVGLAMDGFGFGEDGHAWGGECLYVDGDASVRAGCLKPVPMPGGDAASRQPWRMAVAWLCGHGSLLSLFKEMPVEAIEKLCASERTGMTTSAGRLFDAASAIVLGSRQVSFEGEAAIALEKVATGAVTFRQLAYRLDEHNSRLQLDCRAALAQLAEMTLAGESNAELAAGFHRMLAAGFSEMAMRVAKARDVQVVVLAGGCFLNKLLKERITARLTDAGLTVLSPERVPQGDGAIALGQAWVAIQQMKRGKI